MDDLELWKAVISSLGAFAPFAVLSYWVMRTQAETIKTKDAELAKLNDKILDALKASTAALTEVRVELRQ